MTAAVLIMLLVFWIAPAVLVFFHADKRTDDPALWAIVTLIGGLLGVVLYLVMGGDSSRAPPATGGDGQGVICLECEAVNEWAADYCCACGAGLRVVCPDCGERALISKSFCQTCGGDLSQGRLPGTERQASTTDTGTGSGSAAR